ncbi:MAG: Tar ligand binding domain-containing protein [Gammaproteobacteria bacterium]|nr:Tar ligand binding domain-containing protein [Gammaproteobacteria bacterium]
MDAVDRNLATLDEHLRSYLGGNLSPAEQQIVGNFQRQLDQLIEQGVRPAYDFMQQGRFEDSNRAILTRLQPAFMSLQSTARELVQTQLAAAENQFTESEENFSSLLRLAMMITLGVIILLVRNWRDWPMSCRTWSASSVPELCRQSVVDQTH